MGLKNKGKIYRLLPLCTRKLTRKATIPPLIYHAGKYLSLLLPTSDSQSLRPAIHFSHAASKLSANTFHCTPSISTHLLAVYLWSLLPQQGSHSQTSLAASLSEIHKERNTHPKPSVPCPVSTGFKAQKTRTPANLTGTKHTLGSKGCC